MAGDVGLGEVSTVRSIRLPDSPPPALDVLLSTTRFIKLACAVCVSAITTKIICASQKNLIET